MKIIEKTFQILEIFLDHGDELSLDELSRLSGFNKPTTRRIALSLIECGYLNQNKPRGKYALGMKFLDYSGAIKMHNNVIRVAGPRLMELSQQLKESSTMAIWDGTRTALCQSYLAEHPLRVVPDEGSRLVLHATCVGKALLSELPEDQLGGYLGEMKRFTPNTVIDIDELRKQLISIRKEGIAFDDEEYYQGVRGLGVTIRNGEENVIGSIGVLGPSVRMTRARLREYVPVIKNCARNISRELGYVGGSTEDR